MPIFFQQDIDSHTKLGVWKIEEDENFFLRKVSLQRTITHPHKRLQHLAGRFLLQYLFPDFPLSLIQIADTRKPFLEDEAYHFSISHCNDFAAVIVSKNKRVGVDIEVISDKIKRIQHKFVNDHEQKLFEGTAALDQTELATLIWSCKEAVFKWYGLGEVDFKKHIQIDCISFPRERVIDVPVSFKKDVQKTLSIRSLFFKSTWLSYLVTEAL
jgi:phosphopantetheinyl transferase